jgi:nucleoid-associated protein YgaU
LNGTFIAFYRQNDIKIIIFIETGACKMRNIRIIAEIMTAALFLLSSEAVTADSANKANNVEAITAKIKNTEEQSDKIEDEIVSKIYEIKDTVDNYSKSEKELKGFNGLGRIEVLQLKAQRYAIEKQARKLIEKEVMGLISMLKKWEKIKTQLKEEKKLLSLQQKIIDLETNVSEEQAMNLNKENIEYYQVKKAATLKEISALPEVYSDASKWRLLYNANKDKIKNPTEVIKEGVTLIVPDLKTQSQFDL